MRFRVKDKPSYFEQRNVWKFAWFPKRMKMWPSDSQGHTDVYRECWVWLEKYHVIQYYSNHGFWFDMYSWIYPDNKKVILG